MNLLKLSKLRTASKDNKFIGGFVHEMYAILIGIGLGNVIFIQQINLSSIFEIGMALFVTGVILLYWWDWTEYIAENVVSTKREFIIDFLILITLELFFLFFTHPIKLSFAFILLGIWDLFWVFNYISENNGEFVADNRRWLFEKLGAISLYGISFAINYFVLANFDRIWGGLLIILTFTIVRNLSFKQVKKSMTYMMVKAVENEYDDIVKINNSYLGAENSDAFIIIPLTIEAIKENVSNGHIYYVMRFKGKEDILGFVEIAPTVGDDVLRKVKWSSDDIREEFEVDNENLMYIEKIVVNKDYSSKGVGKAIYSRLFTKHPSVSFYSFVMSKPYTNQRSILFHEKNNFTEGGTFYADNFAGFENYESKLFFIKKD
ncbi:GNAT family N-acetyltransferase [Prolixibacteraceae bacterium JC049]|nr:GNAT family N-acetyltransferase [Prolixibacteraceae bacterium JC049]